MDQAEVQAEMPEVLALAGAGQGFETFAAAVGARQQIEVAMRKVMAHGRQAIELARRHGWSGEPVVAIAYPMLAGSLIWQGELDEAERWLMEGGYALKSEVEPATEMLFQLVRGFLEIARGHATRGSAPRIPR
jgi:LuxR family maltose regulon positive regulatory protein